MSSRRHSLPRLCSTPRRAGQQGGDGIRTPIVAAAGSTITVEVGPNDRTVDIVEHGTGAVTTVQVSPGKDTQVTIPNVPGGSFLNIEIGTGTSRRILLVEVISLSHGGG